MTELAAIAPHDPLRACTVSRSIERFAGLPESLTAELGDAWGDLDVFEATAFLAQAEAADLDFITVALGAEDEADLPLFGEVVRAAVERDVRVIVVARDISPIALHNLLSLGATCFVPFPLPPGALRDAVARCTVVATATAKRTSQGEDIDRDGAVLAVHGLAGGTGATTFAVNLAWELAHLDKANPPRVCLIDLDLQFGSTSTYLDLARREAVFELLTKTDGMDRESFGQAFLTYRERLSVLTAPAELLPLDLVGPQGISRLIAMAQSRFDYVVVDMPRTLVMWSETVLQAAHLYFALLQLDMRSAQNALRMIRALKSEQLPVEKLRYVLNRAPGFTDLSGRGRVKTLASSLDIALEVQLPDGGRAVSDCCDNGLPLALGLPKSPLRKEIRKLAERLHAHDRAEAKAAA